MCLCSVVFSNILQCPRETWSQDLHRWQCRHWVKPIKSWLVGSSMENLSQLLYFFLICQLVGGHKTVEMYKNISPWSQYRTKNCLGVYISYVILSCVVTVVNGVTAFLQSFMLLDLIPIAERVFCSSNSSRQILMYSSLLLDFIVSPLHDAGVLPPSIILSFPPPHTP